MDHLMEARTLISDNGRHLAMMPHPERCFLSWQNPWYPKEWNETIFNKKSNNFNAPWSLMFKNAYEWCKNNDTEINYII